MTICLLLGYDLLCERRLETRSRATATEMVHSSLVMRDSWHRVHLIAARKLDAPIPSFELAARLSTLYTPSFGHIRVSVSIENIVKSALPRCPQSGSRSFSPSFTSTFWTLGSRELARLGQLAGFTLEIRILKELNANCCPTVVARREFALEHGFV